MTKLLVCLAAAGAQCLAAADPPAVRPIGLREAVRLARAAGPAARLARLEVEKSATDARLVRSESSLQLHAASGLGATAGIPQSIQGAAPSVAQVVVRKPVFDVARARRADGATALTDSRRHAADASIAQAMHRAGTLYLDFELAWRRIGLLERQHEAFERIVQLMQARVDEGLEIPLALTRARLDASRAAERLAAAADAFELLEADLRATLGLDDAQRLQPVPTDADGSLGVPEPPGGEARVADGGHPELAGLDAGIRAARQRAREARSGRYPTLDLVGQYAMLAEFNNYDDFFRRFQRHNWQAGVALQIPLFTGRGLAERVARARIDERELEIRREAARAAIRLEGRTADAALREAERSGDLAEQELAYARESLDVLMAQFEQGDIALAEVERARIIESTAWSGVVEARYRLAKSRLDVAKSARALERAFAD